MILAAPVVQVHRNPCLRALGVCVRVFTTVVVLVVVGRRMPIPSCRRDLQVSRCTSA